MLTITTFGTFLPSLATPDPGQTINDAAVPPTPFVRGAMPPGDCAPHAAFAPKRTTKWTAIGNP